MALYKLGARMSEFAFDSGCLFECIHDRVITKANSSQCVAMGNICDWKCVWVPV